MLKKIFRNYKKGLSLFILAALTTFLSSFQNSGDYRLTACIAKYNACSFFAEKDFIDSIGPESDGDIHEFIGNIKECIGDLENCVDKIN